MSRQQHGDGQFLGAGQPQRRRDRQGRRLERSQAGNVTVFRSQLLRRPGFFRVFDLGDHVGAEVGQLREAGTSWPSPCCWRDMVKAVEPDLLKCLPNRGYKQTSSGALLEMLSQYLERSGGRAA